MLTGDIEELDELDELDADFARWCQMLMDARIDQLKRPGDAAAEGLATLAHTRCEKLLDEMSRLVGEKTLEKAPGFHDSRDSDRGKGVVGV